MTWTTGYVHPDWRDGYTHLIRSSADPEESLRGFDGIRHRRWGVAPHLRVRAMHADDIAAAILQVLGRSELTFNAISVRAFDLGADIAFGTLINAVLWDLVEEEALDHTCVAPILFRRAK